MQRQSIGRYIPLTARKGESVAQWISKWWRNKNARESCSGVGVNNGDVTAGRRTTKSDKTMACCLCFLSSTLSLRLSSTLLIQRLDDEHFLFPRFAAHNFFDSDRTKGWGRAVETTFESRHTSFVSLFPAVLKIISNQEAFAWNRYTSASRILNSAHLFSYFIYFPFFLSFSFFTWNSRSLVSGSRNFSTKFSTSDTSRNFTWAKIKRNIFTRACRQFRLELVRFPAAVSFFRAPSHASRVASPYAQIVHASLSQFGH